MSPNFGEPKSFDVSPTDRGKTAGDGDIGRSREETELNHVLEFVGVAEVDGGP